MLENPNLTLQNMLANMCIPRPVACADAGKGLVAALTDQDIPVAPARRSIDELTPTHTFTLFRMTAGQSRTLKNCAARKAKPSAVITPGGNKVWQAITKRKQSFQGSSDLYVDPINLEGPAQNMLIFCLWPTSGPVTMVV